MSQSEESLCHLLYHLDASPDATQRKMAGLLGISLSKLNYCLKALVAKGWGTGNFSRNPNKKGYYLSAHVAGGARARHDFPSSFLQTKMREFDRLQREIEALQKEARRVGHLWMRRSDLNNILPGWR